MPIIKTKAEAEEVRKWRVDEGCTWRAIAFEAAERWPHREILSDNQIDGMQICGEAAKLLGEDMYDGEWN